MKVVSFSKVRSPISADGRLAILFPNSSTRNGVLRSYETNQESRKTRTGPKVSYWEQDLSHFLPSCFPHYHFFFSVGRTRRDLFEEIHRLLRPGRNCEADPE